MVSPTALVASAPKESSKVEVLLQQFLWPVSILFYGTLQLLLLRRCECSSKWFARFILASDSLIFSVFYQLLVSVFESYLQQTALSMLLVSSALLTLHRLRHRDNARRVETAVQSRLACITWTRGSLFLATAVCILAVDFPSFPTRFSKCESRGVSLMDVGVGWYVVVNAMSRSNALTESESSELFKATPTQSRVPKWAMHSVPLLMLGLLRLAAVKLLGYHVSKAEYGLHWNFFFTLFSVRTWLTCVRKVPKRLYTATLLVTTCFFLVTTEVLLHHQMTKDYLLNSKRNSLVSSNREGLVSLLGYFALMNVSVLTTRLTMLPFWLPNGRHEKSKLALLTKLVLVTVLFAVALLVSELTLGAPFRRFANSSYVFWILLGSTLLLVFFLAVEIIVDSFGVDLKWPPLFYLLSQFGLVHFLVANVLTGIVNLTMKPRNMSDPLLASAVQAGYLMATNGITAIYASYQCRKCSRRSLTEV